MKKERKTADKSYLIGKHFQDYWNFHLMMPKANSRSLRSFPPVLANRRDSVRMTALTEDDTA
jgi:hypothetical protein